MVFPVSYTRTIAAHKLVLLVNANMAGVKSIEMSFIKSHLQRLS